MEDKVGTTVVLDPRDGAVRAMVSNPSYDPNRFSRRLKPEEWRGLLEAPHHPLQNRAVQNTFPPGSLFKIIAGYAGLVEGVITPRDRVYCPGATTIYNHRFRCWRPSGHGWVNLEESLKHSCDIYFYHLGQKLGIQRLARYSRLFGLGRITGIDLAGEKPGLVPDPEWSQQVRGTRWYPGETISVAIGQGALLTSPLQVARLVAATANGGRLVTPHLLDEVLPPSTQVPVDDSARGGAAGLPNRVANQSLELDLQALEVIQRGLWKVVNEEKGTGVGAQMTEMELAGKTGTSQVITQKTWIRSEDLPWPQRDHAWFGAYGPYQEPTLVVVIFLEHGGSGSGAAPLAKAIYEKHLELDTSGPA